MALEAASPLGRQVEGGQEEALCHQKIMACKGRRIPDTQKPNARAHKHNMASAPHSTGSTSAASKQGKEEWWPHLDRQKPLCTSPQRSWALSCGHTGICVCDNWTHKESQTGSLQMVTGACPLEHQHCARWLLH